MLHLCKKFLNSLVKIIFDFLILFYRSTISIWMGRQCRFEPTCSQYAKDAIRKHGFMVGSKLFIIRFLKCNPFYRPKEGYIADNVPDKT